MAKKTPRSKAWDAFSIYVRLRDAIKTTRTKTHLVCYTCGKRYPAFGVGCAQAGHFIPSRSNSVLIDEIGVNGQCYNCNHNLKGNWVEYERHLLKEYGVAEVERLKANKFKTIKIPDCKWLELEDLYKAKTKTLLDEYR